MTAESTEPTAADGPTGGAAPPARPIGVDLGKTEPTPTNLPAAIAAPAVAPLPSALPLYFPVSAVKLVVMSICTFGLYDLYWHYKNWQLVKARENSDIMPFWRAFFAFFFCYDLFKRVDRNAEEAGLPIASAGVMAAGWIICRLAGRLPELYWLIAFLAVGFLVPVQNAVNRLNARHAPGVDPNRRFSGWNIAGVVFGGLLLLLAIIGSFLPDEPEASGTGSGPSKSPLAQVLQAA